MKRKIRKDVTINDLADTIDSLAISVANGFSVIDKKFTDKFDGVYKRFDTVDKRLTTVEDVLKKTGQDVLNIRSFCTTL